MRTPHRTKGIYSSSLCRATGGPEVAMGTGPWPQPPTEAEQLQALMATANGESWAVSFLFPRHHDLSDCVPQRSLCVGGRWQGSIRRF